MRQAYTVVRESIKANFDRSKKRYDARVKSAKFEVGNKVYYYVPRKHVGNNKKWTLDNRGPFTVTRKVNEVNYAIQKSSSSQPLVVHIDRLTRCHSDDEGTETTGRETSSSTTPDSSMCSAPQSSVSDQAIADDGAVQVSKSSGR